MSLRRALPITILIFAGCNRVSPPTFGCEGFLPDEVEAKLAPVVTAREVASKKPDWSYPKYEEELDKLLADKSYSASRARVALMDYYVGEAFGEELVCAVAREGKTVLPLLQYHSRCDVKAKVKSSFRDRRPTLIEYTIHAIQIDDPDSVCNYD